jgi:hypothetical protein
MEMSAGGKIVRVKDRAHQINMFNDILNHIREGGWVWSYRDVN